MNPVNQIIVGQIDASSSKVGSAFGSLGRASRNRRDTNFNYEYLLR